MTNCISSLSINSIKQQESRHLGFGVFIDIWSMYWLYTPLTSRWYTEFACEFPLCPWESWWNCTHLVSNSRILLKYIWPLCYLELVCELHLLAQHAVDAIVHGFEVRNPSPSSVPLLSHLQGCGSALIWVAVSGSGSRRAKMTHKNRKKYRIVLKCWMFSFEGWTAFPVAWASCMEA